MPPTITSVAFPSSHGASTLNPMDNVASSTAAMASARSGRSMRSSRRLDALKCSDFSAGIAASSTGDCGPPPGARTPGGAGPRGGAVIGPPPR